MPARKVITARQERLATELRKLRERTGLPVQEAARALGIAQPKLSSTESARVGVSPDRVRHFASQYACDDAPLVEALAAMAAERGNGWWEEYRELLPSGFLDLAELEANARYLNTIEIAHVPGLLQTEDQVRAIFAYSVPEFPTAQLEARVAYRLRRQSVLDGPEAPPYEAVIHEAALRIRVADRPVAQRQLAHILEMTQRPGITVRVIPFDVNGFAGVGYSMLYAGGPVPQLDTVLLDSVHGVAFLDSESQLDRYRALFDKVKSAALDEAGSRDFIHRLTKEV
ncbi:transcriptional regulator [Streptomyces longisporoflavus]|uniref:helix-turn-helix domain-containing protein n=1 Tax=Streptomyces longisporoflavus TaxID=28044 RepID=UPI00167E321D|nr:helix-turn-helix transcriptional regulator [Streptomyces longisporoflavus]GGV53263.1 transcriptional regulator [Streptomyces longisporoflavus]